MPRSKHVQRLLSLSLREALLIGIPAAALIVGAFWAAAHFVKPAPPRHVVMATGPEAGGYSEFGQAYKAALARNDIELELRPTRGSVENYQLLNDPESGVDIALMQSGVGSPDEAPDLVTLGSVSYEPLWVFCRGRKPVDRLLDLKGRTLAIGEVGSGTREFAQLLLKANGLDQGGARLLDLGGLEAAEALLVGRVDCLFLMAAPQAGLLKALFYAPGVRLVNFEHAEAYVRRIPTLTRVTMPEGTIDLQLNLPSERVTLVAATAQLVARQELHPAVQMLLMQAAQEIHAKPTLISKKGDFPSPDMVEFPLSPDASRYYQSGKPFLQRYLPFWLANLVDRMLVMLVPIVAVVFPLTRIIPPLYQWRMRSRIYRWYGELMFLDNEIRAGVDATKSEEYEKRIDWLESEVNDLHPPLAFADQLYHLRQHIDFVRHRLELNRGQAVVTGR